MCVHRRTVGAVKEQSQDKRESLPVLSSDLRPPCEDKNEMATFCGAQPCPRQPLPLLPAAPPPHALGLS